MDWQDAIDDFIDAHSVRWEPTTVTWYRNELQLFARFCDASSIEFASVRCRHALKFLAERKERGVSANTLRKWGWVASSFLSYWTDQGVFSTNPLGPTFCKQLPRREGVIVPVPKPDALRKLIAAIEAKHAPNANPSYHQSRNFRSFLRTRDLALVAMFCELGPRVSEICRLDLSDVKLESRELLFRKRKNKQPLALPISAKCAAKLQAYLNVRARQRLDGDMLAVFVSINGTRLTRDGVRKQIDRYWAETREHFTLHSFRHYAIKHNRREGGLKFAQRIAGQEDPRSTMRYGELDTEEIRGEIERIDTLGSLMPPATPQRKRRIN